MAPIIKTVSVNETFKVFGHIVKGYDALFDAVEVRSSTGTMRRDAEGNEVVNYKPYMSIQEPQKRINGLHILQVYQRFPCFDSYDYAYEDRFFRVFFISDRPFSEEQITRIACNKDTFSPERLPGWMLPAVYHADESGKMTIINRPNRFRGAIRSFKQKISKIKG